MSRKKDKVCVTKETLNLQFIFKISEIKPYLINRLTDLR